MKVLGIHRGYTAVRFKQRSKTRPAVYLNDNLSAAVPQGKASFSLSIDGTEVVIPRKTRVSIGSSPRCDIFINDARVAQQQLTLFYDGINLLISHHSNQNRSIVWNQATREKAKLEEKGRSVFISGNGLLYVEVFGIEFPLIFEVKLNRSGNAPERRPLLARLPIEYLTPEQALAKRAERQAVIESFPLKVDLRNTRFAGAQTIAELTDLYLFHLHQIRKEEKNLGRLLNGLSTFLFTPGLLFLALSQPSSLLIIGPLYLAALLIGFSLSGGRIRSLHPLLNQLNQDFLVIINILDNNEKSNMQAAFKYILSRLDKTKEKDRLTLDNILLITNSLKSMAGDGEKQIR